ncbi:MAG: hypothetical protein FJ148_16110 [Deltaproteobacteria bacterium]|nr:hypothetical protein [Deltaproteobacteria bacterium]
MSQSKEITRESRHDGGQRSGLSGTSRHDALSARLRILLDERARLVEQLALVDLDLDLVRTEAAEGARCSRDVATTALADEGSFEVSAHEFVRGAAEPPGEVDRDDFEQCLGKVILALRRNGDRLAGATLQVRYHVGAGCVLSIWLRRADGIGAGREVYRRADGHLSATG